MKRRLLTAAMTLLGICSLTLGTVGVRPAYAATTITVNTTNDESMTDGVCSLREAINNANANSDTTGGDCAAGTPGADTIDLSSVSGTITLVPRYLGGLGNLPTITDALTITGPGANRLTINADGNDTVFFIFANATIAGVTATGAAGSCGNQFAGGIVFNGTSLTVQNSSITGNSSCFHGGGLVNGVFPVDSGTVTVENSTISNNSGDGIFNDCCYHLFLTNSTITGNSDTIGGGILNNGTMTLANSTISGNSSTVGGVCCTGGGILNNGLATFENTIVAGNNGGDCFSDGSLTDAGYNLSSTGTCGFDAANHSQPIADPLLDPAGLGDNGGPTQTIALEPGSPAIDAIPAGVNGCGTTITRDQRGVSRPQGAGCEIGAFEFVQQTLTVRIDIKPGQLPNVIDLGSRGTIPVAVLSTAHFNAPGQVDTASLKFGRTGNESSLVSCSPPQDVNRDGLLDVLCHFSARKTDFQLGDTQGVLTGNTSGGTSIRGTDSVVVVPPS
jgi:CSLREA domain-containing protein